jgi:hypothetical protein
MRTPNVLKHPVLSAAAIFAAGGLLLTGCGGAEKQQQASIPTITELGTNIMKLYAMNLDGPKSSTSDKTTSNIYDDNGNPTTTESTFVAYGNTDYTFTVTSTEADSLQGAHIESVSYEVDEQPQTVSEKAQGIITAGMGSISAPILGDYNKAATVVSTATPTGPDFTNYALVYGSVNMLQTTDTKGGFVISRITDKHTSTDAGANLQVINGDLGTFNAYLEDAFAQQDLEVPEQLV